MAIRRTPSPLWFWPVPAVSDSVVCQLAAGAMFRDGQSVVVVFEPDRPGGSVTRPQGN